MTRSGHRCKLALSETVSAPHEPPPRPRTAAPVRFISGRGRRSECDDAATPRHQRV